MKYFFYITSIFFIVIVVGCNEEPACCDSIPGFPRIKVLDSNNVDLLDPNVQNHFDHSGISFSTLFESKIVQLDFEISEPSIDAGLLHYKLRLTDDIYASLTSNKFHDYYLRLDSFSIDTISLTIELNQITEYILNGEEWLEYDNQDFAYVIRK